MGTKIASGRLVRARRLEVPLQKGANLEPFSSPAPPWRNARGSQLLAMTMLLTRLSPITLPPKKIEHQTSSENDNYPNYCNHGCRNHNSYSPHTNSKKTETNQND